MTVLSRFGEEIRVFKVPIVHFMVENIFVETLIRKAQHIVDKILKIISTLN